MPRFHPTIEIALGATVTGTPSSWSWTDLTMQGFVHDPSGIQIQRGRGDRFSEATPDTCALTLLNDSGRFVPSNPLSPYYGSLRRGTPLRVLMRPNTNSASDAFGRTASSGWGTADSGGAWTVVGTAADYAASATNGGRMTQGTANVQHVAVLSASVLRVDLQVRVRVNALSTGAAQSAGLVFRYSGTGDFIRAVVEFGTSGALTARIVHRSGGVETAGTGVTVSGLTHSTSTWYRVRVQTGYNAVRMKVWQDGTTEPATWTLDGATAALTILTAGQFGCYALRAAGNTNASATTDFDDFSMLDAPRTQFTGTVDAWPVRWNDAGLSQSFAPITASGNLLRLSRARATRSAIYRACTQNYVDGTSTAVAYWPMEDGSTAKTFASGIGGQAQTFTDMRPAADSSVIGSQPLPILDGTGRFAFRVPQYTATGTWAVRWVMKIPSSSLSGSAAQIMSWTVTGGSPIVRWQMTLNPGTPDTVSLSGWNAAGTAVFTGSNVNFVDPTSSAELSDGRQLYFEVDGAQNGGNVDTTWTVRFVPDDGSAAATSIGTAQSTATTNANVSLIYHDAPNGFSPGGHTIGHVGLGNDTGFGASSDGVSAGASDYADTRFAMLCSDQGVVSLFGDLIRGVGTTTQQMGPLAVGDVLQQLQLVESTEGGILYDGKSGFIHLLPREMRYNRAIDLTADIAQQDVGWPFEPTDDDFLLRNDVTASNTNGSSARSIDESSIALQGVHADSVSVNTWRDSDLQLQADWRLNMGLANGMRIPTIVLNLTKNYLRLSDAWCDVDIGSRIQITNIPSGELPPETLDLVVDGYTETITSSTWTATLNVSPSGQWLAGVLDTNRLDCAASVTSGTLTTTATSVPLTITDTCVWTHADGDFSIYIGGEKMLVTAVSAAVGSGSSWTQTLTVTRSTNGIVKTHSAGEAVHVANPVILAL